MANGQAGPGWLTDPTGRHDLRYWDGSAWTGRVSDAGEQGVDLLGIPSAPPQADTAVPLGTGSSVKGGGSVRGIWRGFRAWPMWLQIVIWVFLGLFVLGGIGSATGTGDDQEESKPTSKSHSTSTTNRPRRTTTSLTTTTAQPKPPVDPAVSARRRLRRKISDELGSSNRSVEPRYTVVYNEGLNVVVTWAINENLTEGLIKDSARLEATDILKAIRAAKVGDYSGATLEGTYSLVDKLGNASEERVVLAMYSKGVIDAIDFDNFYFKDVFDPGVADSVQIHPAFQY